MQAARASRVSMSQQSVLCTQLEVGWAPPATLLVLRWLPWCCRQNSGRHLEPSCEQEKLPQDPGEQKGQVASPKTQPWETGTGSYAKPRKGRYAG